MRSLSGTLTTAQENMAGAAIWKIVLTRSGQTTRTYGVDTTDRCLSIRHTEEPFSQTAQVMIGNMDSNLTGLDLEGYKGVISKGYNTSAGDEYSAYSPLYVMSQQMDSWEGGLVALLSLGGIFNLMSEDHASDDYVLEDTNADTLKTILTSVIDASISVFNHCTAYTATYGTEDAIVDSYKPKDSFRIYYRESRTRVIQRLLAHCGMVARIEADGAVHLDKQIVSQPADWAASTAYVVGDTIKPTTPNDHIYKCTTAGTSGGSEPTWGTTIGGTTSDNTVTWTLNYDYTYELVSGSHFFWQKSYRKRMVAPNKITVESFAEQTPAYTGNATADSQSILEMADFRRMTLASNQEGTDIAQAIINKLEDGSERGNLYAPMNVGQEVHDLVRVVDKRDNDNVRIGNVLQIVSNCDIGWSGTSKYECWVRFGDPLLGSPANVIPPSLTKKDIAQLNIQDLRQQIDEWGKSIWEGVLDVAQAVDAAMAQNQAYIDYILSVLHEIIWNPLYRRRAMYIKALDADTALTTGDGKVYITIPEEFNNMNLVKAHAFVYTASTSGTPTVQIHNLTDAADMLSTKITIDANEKNSYTAAAAPVIDTANDDVVEGDVIRIDVDVAGTGTKGLDIMLTFKYTA